MRKTLGLATFAALTASTAAVGALNMRGSDTLKTITQEVITECGAPTAGLIYDGTGSSNGQNAMATNNQQIAPMSRAINGSGCSTNPNGEGIVIGLDGLSIIASSTVAAACSANPAAGEDCDRTTDAATGVAYSKTFDTAVNCASDAECTAVDASLSCNLGTGKCKYTLGNDAVAAFAGTANDWKDALRLIYAGLDQNDGNSMANRDCDSPIRVALVNNWSNVFESSCAVGGCTELRHAFRRDDESGTTDTFVSLLDMPSINLSTNVSPFCNALGADKDNITAASCTKDAECKSFDCNESTGKCVLPKRPYFVEYQDNDPIRRACVGTGNLPGPPFGAAGGPPPSEPTEQVCGKDGTLGLVLPINPVPGGSASAPVQYPTKNCHKGRFVLGDASFVETITTPPPPKTIIDRCPNGDRTAFGGCFIPVSTDFDTACINGKNNLPGFVLDTANATATDGRVYNKYLRRGGTGADRGAFATITRGAGTSSIQADQVGAFYRLHVTRSLAAAPSTTNLCNVADSATNQLGCLTIASPCSISFAGNEGAGYVTDAGAAAALEVNALEPSDACVRKLILAGSGTPYPLARKLYVNSLDGFENLAAQSLAAPESELALAQCFSNDSIVHTAVKNAGFITLGDVSGQPGACSQNASVFCEATCAGGGDCSDHAASGVTTRTAPIDLAANWVANDANPNACP